MAITLISQCQYYLSDIVCSDHEIRYEHGNEWLVTIFRVLPMEMTLAMIHAMITPYMKMKLANETKSTKASRKTKRNNDDNDDDVIDDDSNGSCLFLAAGSSTDTVGSQNFQPFSTS